jgi:hypothetical protein
LEATRRVGHHYDPRDIEQNPALRKRKPIFYVQTIINLPNRDIKTINAGMQIILAGYATSEDLDASPLRDFGSKFGGKGGYLCHYIQISKLKNMSLFKEDYSKLKNE